MRFIGNATQLKDWFNSLEYIPLLGVILCISWCVGQPYIAKRERKKRNEEKK